MGNSESRASHSNNDESDEEQTLAASSAVKQTSAASLAVKVCAAITGTAILVFGAWESWTETRKSYKYSLIKVMSYNVWFREDVEVIKRMEAIGQLIQKHLPDIILFQEVTPNIYRIFQSSQWWKLYECSAPPERATTRRYFCILLSKLPVKRFIKKSFENSNMGREISIAQLDAVSGKNLVVASSHLEGPTPEKRIAQAKKVLNQLSYFPNVIFGGDMNWDENSDGPFPLHGGWIDAWTKLRQAENGWTYDTKENKSLRGYPPLQKRLDRFVCKLSNFEIMDIEMIGMEAIPELSYRYNKKVNPVYPSDHFGLLLTIST